MIAKRLEDLDRLVLKIEKQRSRVYTPKQREDNELSELLSGDEMAYLIDRCAAILEAEPDRLGLDYVNLLKLHRSDELKLHYIEDLMFIVLTDTSGKTYRALVDTGATLTAVSAKSVSDTDATEFWEKYQNRARRGEKTVVYANSERGKTGNVYENVELTNGDTRNTLSFPVMHEMPLPPGVDILIGLDWLRQVNPIINFKDGTMRKAKTEIVCAVQRAHETSSGQISAKAMRKLATRMPERVTCVRVYDTRLQPSVKYAMATLTRQKLEAILARKKETSEGKIAESDTKANESDIIPKVPKTGYSHLDELIKQFQDVIPTDLSPEIADKIYRNKWRRETLEHTIPLDDEEVKKKIPYRPYRRLSPVEEEECRKVIERYITDGIIEPSASPFGAAVLFAPKKDGSLRFCVDWRPLNKITDFSKETAPSARTSVCHR
jgi:predicted aspartyl protease